MEGIITELLRYAFSGVNIIPTVMLILIQLYWVVASIGFLDLEFLDIDLDLDLEGSEGMGGLTAIAAFINEGEAPFTFTISLVVLNFWILMMLTYFYPFELVV